MVMALRLRPWVPAVIRLSGQAAYRAASAPFIRPPRLDARQVFRLCEIGDERFHFDICFLPHGPGDGLERLLLTANKDEVVSPLGQ
ncbi:MAG: hypothetical protein ACJ8EK_07790, partial [Bradyrhizobium sp.]